MSARGHIVAVANSKRDRLVQRQIRAWRDDLINLTRRNGLLYYKPTRSSTLEIEAPGVFEVVGTLQKHSKAGWAFYEPPEPLEADDEEAVSDLDRKPRKASELLTQKMDAASLNTTLRGLQRRTSQEYLDKGLWVLYLGAAMLEWVDPDSNEAVRSPLVLYPVVIQRENPRSPYRLVLGEEDAVANPALAVKFETDFGIELPRLEDPDGLAEYITTVANLKGVRDRGWHVADQCVIRTFSFHKEVMYRDLELNEDAIAAHPVVRSLALGSDADADLTFEPVPERDLDDVFPPEELIAILDADATQRRCLAAATAGHSFVMDGPPGTGKSQTIANLIASSIYEDKSVLFVSEKAAALDVVSSRLESLGLGEYLLELHSHKATRKQFAYAMAEALTKQPVAPSRLSGAALGEIAEKRRKLSEYALAMNQVREPMQASLHHVLGRLSLLDDAPEAPVPADVGLALTEEDLTSILATAGDWSRAWGPVERWDDFVWSGTNLTGIDTAELQTIDRQLQKSITGIYGLRQAATWVADELGLDLPVGPLDAEIALKLLEIIDRRPVGIPPHWLIDDSLTDAGLRVSEIRELQTTYATHAEALESLVGQSWQNLDSSRLDSLKVSRESFASDPDIGWFDSDMDLDAVRSIDTTLERIGEQCGEILDSGGVLAEAFAMSLDDLSIRDLERLGEVAELVGEGPEPDESWLDQRALVRARESAVILKNAVDDYVARAQDLETVFMAEVLDLDLQGLTVRYEQVHRGVRKLSSVYRADKTAVAQVSHTTKASKDVVARLSDALDWQKSRDRWRDLEASHAGIVGDVYYAGDDTDWDLLDEALDRCGAILEISGGRIAMDALQHNFGVESSPDAAVRAAGSHVVQEVNAMTERLEALQATIGTDRTPTELVDWIGSLRLYLRGVIHGLAHIDSVAGRSMTLRETTSATTEKVVIDQILLGLEGSAQEDATLLGSEYRSLDTDCDALEGSLRWTEDVLQLLGRPLNEDMSTKILSTALTSDALASPLITWGKAKDSVAGWFSSEYRNGVPDLLDGEFEEAVAFLESLGNTTEDIQEWAAFETARARLGDFGLEEVTDFCEESALSGDAVRSAIERAVLTAWSDKTIRRDTRLSPRRRKDRDAIVEEFRALDAELKRHAVAKVVRSCNARRPANASIGPAATIKREGQKKSRHKPIRDLMADTRDVIQALKPCFMMSPMTVSQYLDPDTRFDVVIFDEASQVLPADAINCIYRGTQVIIAGDQKQLPPTSFFQRMGDVDESAEFEEDELDQFESILDIAKGSGLVSLPLLWHYRSRHESLITYSNFSFYSGDLVTYPGATDIGQHVGIEMFKVDGLYRRGTSRDNPVEAEKVAERVLFHAQTHPGLTVGVVAFSEAQASLIQDVVDRTRREHPELDSYFTDDRLSGFFVKNLENVQGDERDIMIFSIGYGPDEFGAPVKGNFGPLTRQGGERRLNVAITRARQRVEVVSSIEAADFKSTWSSAGARHLGRYLDFAVRGMPALALELEDSEAEPESPFEESVLDVVRAWGYDVVPQVGTAGYRIDLGVRDPARPGRYVLGIECDGAMYHSSRVARDRDRLRQEVLEGLGWNIYRIWGTSWYRNREAEVELLRTAIEQAINGNGSSSIKRPEPTINVPVRDVDYAQAPRWVTPYEITRVSVPHHLAMTDGSAQPALRAAIEGIIRGEAPIHETVALTRVREAWGLKRSGRLIQEAFNTQFRILARTDEIKRDRNHFLWTPAGERNLKVRVPVDGRPETKRLVRHVAPEELRQAVTLLLGDAITADREELTALTSRIFGWERRGEEIAAALDRAVTALLRSKRIRRDGSRLRLNDE